MRPPIDGATFLITGASAGIGRELARQLAPRAGTLVLVARRADRLEEIRAGFAERHPRLRVHLETRDLADPSAVENLLASVAEKAGPVDVLINNAGLGHVGLYDRSDWERNLRMIRVNVVALAHLAHRLAPGMVARGRGGIMNVGSGAGFALMPGAAVYTATKHFVTGFTDSLRADLAGTGVVVTHVAPGPVETEFNEVAGVAPGMEGGPPPFLRISAEQCAREAIRGFEMGKAVVFPGGVYRALMTLFPLVPRPLVLLAVAQAARRIRGA